MSDDLESFGGLGAHADATFGELRPVTDGRAPAQVVAEITALLPR
ncbi:hypothetical protein [Micromonospora chokoriensis]